MVEKTTHGLNDQLAKPKSYDSSVSAMKKPENLSASVPPESAEKAEKLKVDLEEFKKKVMKKFPFVQVISVLPAQSFKLFEEDEGMLPEEVAKKPLHIFLLIPEDQFKNIQKKIKPEVVQLAKETKQELWVHIKTEVDLWNYGLDSKYEFLDAISASYPLYDKGILGALRVANIHKTLVLKKFEKYVASYVVAGSLVRGTADKTSDVDTFVIIDDTDVKRMPRMQLLEKLRGMIHDYIREATALAGAKNPLSVQVYLLTDFWDSVKDANPVMFTFIRDGVPMYDRGTFLPWKLLLQMGKVKPSQEAVDKFMKYGEQNEDIVNRRLIDAMVDIYWGVVTPTQALMMLTGHAPPAPKQMVADVKKVLVDEEKVMQLSELKFLEKMIGLYKGYEHGTLKKIPGKDIDEILIESKKFDIKLKEVRKKLEERLIVRDAERLRTEIFALLNKMFKTKDTGALIKHVEKDLIAKGKLRERLLKPLKTIAGLSSSVALKKLTTLEMNVLRRDGAELSKELLDYAQRAELVLVEKGVIEVTFGDKKGELVLTSNGAFFVESGRIMKIENGKFSLSDKATLDKAITDHKKETTLSVSSDILSVLKKELSNFAISL